MGMDIRLGGPNAARWAAWLAEHGHDTTVLRTASEAERGQLVVVTGGDVAACAAAVARGAAVVAVDVTDEVAEAMVDAGARDIWRADASPAWLRAELRMLARTVYLELSARAHHENTLRLNALLSHSETIIASIDREGVFTFVAGEALAGLGMQPEMLIGQCALELFAGRTVNVNGQPMTVGELFARVMLGDTVSVTTIIGGRALDVRFGPLRRDGYIDGAMAVVHDVTERHRVEARARDAEEQLRTVVQNTPMLLIAFDTTGTITLADGYSLRALFAPSEVVGRKIEALYSLWSDTPIVTATDGSAQARGSVVADALAGRSVNGHVRFGSLSFEYCTVPLRRDGQIIGGICVGVDITDRHRAEEARRVADESLRVFMEASPDPVAVMRGDRFVFANRALAIALGYDVAEMVGRSALDFVLEEDREEVARIIALMAGGEPIRGVDQRLRRKDGSLATFHYSGVNIVFDGGPAIVVIGSDVSEQRTMQNKLMLADRMASMGTLAAGVAHEINNPLAYVMANLAVVVEALSDAGASPVRRPTYRARSKRSPTRAKAPSGCGASCAT